MGVEQRLFPCFRVSKYIYTNQCYIRYCEGGELFNYIIEKRYLNENVAAHIMR